MIYDIRIETDEDGFHLRVFTDGEFDLDIPDKSFDFLLSSDAALRLRSEVKENVEEWAQTHEEVKADFERFKRNGERPPYISPPAPTNDWMLEAADNARKRDKENR
jgi:hypothetical protein